MNKTSIYLVFTLLIGAIGFFFSVYCIAFITWNLEFTPTGLAEPFMQYSIERSFVVFGTILSMFISVSISKAVVKFISKPVPDNVRNYHFNVAFNTLKQISFIIIKNIGLYLLLSILTISFIQWNFSFLQGNTNIFYRMSGFGRFLFIAFMLFTFFLSYLQGLKKINSVPKPVVSS